MIERRKPEGSAVPSFPERHAAGGDHTCGVEPADKDVKGHSPKRPASAEGKQPMTSANEPLMRHLEGTT